MAKGGRSSDDPASYQETPIGYIMFARCVEKGSRPAGKCCPALTAVCAANDEADRVHELATFTVLLLDQAMFLHTDVIENVRKIWDEAKMTTSRSKTAFLGSWHAVSV
jgi:hypothetical protein